MEEKMGHLASSSPTRTMQEKSTFNHKRHTVIALFDSPGWRGVIPIHVLRRLHSFSPENRRLQYMYAVFACVGLAYIYVYIILPAGVFSPTSPTLTGTQTIAASRSSSLVTPYNATENLIRRYAEFGYDDMVKHLKIYVYPYMNLSIKLTWEEYRYLIPKSRELVRVFKNHTEREYGEIGIEADKLPFASAGTFGSGGTFFENLRNSRYITKNPEEATFFFMPIACEAQRALYVEKIKGVYPYWNRTQGADHVYVCTHLGASVSHYADPNMRSKAIAIVCPGDLQNPYFVPQKDIVIPPYVDFFPKTDYSWFETRTKTQLAFYAGGNTARVRSMLHRVWKGDGDIRIEGTKVNTPRINEVTFYGCIPVIISDHYHLPLNGLVDWSKIALVIPEKQVPKLKDILKSISRERHRAMLDELRVWRRSLVYHCKNPTPRDAFEGVLLMLWQRRHYMRYEDPVIEPFTLKL